LGALIEKYEDENVPELTNSVQRYATSNFCKKVSQKKQPFVVKKIVCTSAKASFPFLKKKHQFAP
jgi:hypothetical protein